MKGIIRIGSYAFYGCGKLTDVNIPASISDIGEYAFEYCRKLVNVTIPGSVLSVGYSAFEDCDSLIVVEIQEGVKIIGGRAFCNCNKVKDVEIPKSVLSIGGSAFATTKWLETEREKNSFVVVNHILIDGQTCSGEAKTPEGVTSIGEDAFKDSSLTSLEISEGVTSIGNSAFWRCKSLDSVSIPKSVTSIGSGVFASCDNFKTIYGYSGTYAETYAKKNGYEFISLGIVEEPIPTMGPTDTPPAEEIETPAPSKEPTETPPAEETETPAPSKEPTETPPVEETEMPAPSKEPTETPPAEVTETPAPPIEPTETPSEEVTETPAPSKEPTEVPSEEVTETPVPAKEPTEVPTELPPEKETNQPGGTEVPSDTPEADDTESPESSQPGDTSNGASQGQHVVTLTVERTGIGSLEMSVLIAVNQADDVVIQTTIGVTFTFKKGTMKTISGKNLYDFGIDLITDYRKAGKNPFVEKDFAFKIHYNYDGELPGQAFISIPMDKKWIGKTLYYYMVNADGSYAYMMSGTVDKNGIYTVRQNHCSDYIATTKTPEEMEGTKASENIGRSPKTNDSTRSWLYVILGAGSIATVIVVRRRERIR